MPLTLFRDLFYSPVSELHVAKECSDAMPATPINNGDSQTQPSSWATGFAHFRSYLLVICFILMAAAIAFHLIKDTIQNQLRDQIVQRIEERLDGSPFAVKLADARWFEGRGLQLSGITIEDTRLGKPVIEVESAFAQSAFQLTDLLSIDGGGPKIDEVTIERAHVSLVEHAGDWTIQQLITKLKECDLAGNCKCPITMRDSSITLDASSSPTGQAIRVQGISLRHQRDTQDPLIETCVGMLSAPMAGQLDFDVTINRGTGIWQGKASAKKVQINESLAESLSQAIGGNAVLKAVRGKLAINAAATGYLDQSKSPRFRVLGQAIDMHCLADELPHQIHNAGFRFDLNNDQLKITDAHCRIGYGTIAGSAEIQNPLSEPKWRIVGRTTDFLLTNRVVAWLPEKMKRQWSNFQPEGSFDADFEFHNHNGTLSRSIRSTIKDGAVSWYRFPFRISRANGTMNWIGDHLSMDMVAVEAQQTVTIRGEVDDPGENWTGWAEGESKGLIPINDKMLAAFDFNKRELAKSLRKFKAVGHVSGWGRLERHNASADAKMDFRINLENATVRHDNFDYPINNITGLILVENDKTLFRELRGVNKNGLVQCNGSWVRHEGLRLKFLANNVALDEELRQALPANFQKSWLSIRPTGTVDEVDLDMIYPTGTKKLETVVTVRVLPQSLSTTAPSNVSIKPTWFPYEMRSVTGEFSFANSRIGIKNFSANHGNTSINCNGSGAYDPSTWKVRLTDLMVSDIYKDKELMAALPASIRRGWESVQFVGNLNMLGTIEASGQFLPTLTSQNIPEIQVGQATPIGSTPNSHWNSVRQTSYVDAEPATSDLRMDWALQFGIGAANANIGVEVKNANGGLRLAGSFANDQLFTNGLLSIDSMSVNEMQVTKFAAPISIDNDSIGLGSFAKVTTAQQKATAATGHLFGGYIECDAQIKTGGNNDYYFQSVLTDAKLDEFALETSMQQHDFSGQAFGKIQLYGDSTGTHSMRGTGEVQLRNAKIYEVPVMIALFNVLRVRNPDRTAFDQGKLEFLINGENIDFQKIELNGNALSLIGRGTVNLDREVELDFYTMMGRNRWFIPILTKLYQAGSQQVWWIKVDGSLDKPESNHEVLPGLNDSLRALFPEFATEANQNQKR